MTTPPLALSSPSSSGCVLWRGTRAQCQPLLHCKQLPLSGQIVNLCRLDAKLKFKHTQQLEGSLDSKHRVQTEEASPKGLKFSPVFTGKSNSLNPLLGPQSQPGDQTQSQPCPPLLPRVQGREMVFQAVGLPWTKVPAAPGTHSGSVHLGEGRSQPDTPPLASASAMGFPQLL